MLARKARFRESTITIYYHQYLKKNFLFCTFKFNTYKISINSYIQKNINRYSLINFLTKSCFFIIVFIFHVLSCYNREHSNFRFFIVFVSHAVANIKSWNSNVCQRNGLYSANN